MNSLRGPAGESTAHSFDQTRRDEISCKPWETIVEMEV